MDDTTGRCAILFPHGILFRDEEQDMRIKLVKSDLVECVIGIGKNLFFNSPMEACIVICRSKKKHSQKGKILFINAKNEVTRENAKSFLEQNHIDKIVEAYCNFEDVDGFSKVVPIGDILENNGKLSIALYVKNSDEAGFSSDMTPDVINDWQYNSLQLDSVVQSINKIVKEV